MAGRHSRAHRATGFVQVAAIAELALAAQGLLTRDNTPPAQRVVPPTKRNSFNPWRINHIAALLQFEQMHDRGRVAAPVVTLHYFLCLESPTPAQRRLSKVDLPTPDWPTTAVLRLLRASLNAPIPSPRTALVR